MNTFLEQFYDIPVDINAMYLKRIFSNDYLNFLSNFKNVKKLTAENIENLRGDLYIADYKERNYYLYDLKDCRFIFTLGKFPTGEMFATIEYLEKENTKYRQNETLPYKIIYLENDERENEYTVQFFWHTGKDVTKSYVVLKYKNIEHVLLKRSKLFDPNNIDLGKPAEINVSIFNKTLTWLNRNNQKHRNLVPAEITYTKNMSQITHQYWFQKGKLHRQDQPAVIIYDLKKRLKKEAYWNLNKKHNLENAAEKYFNYSDCMIIQIWYINDELVKTDVIKL